MHTYQRRLMLLLILFGLTLLVPARGFAQPSTSARSRSRQSRQTRQAARIVRCAPGRWRAESQALKDYMLAAIPDATLSVLSGRITYFFDRNPSTGFTTDFEKVRFYVFPREGSTDDLVITVDGFGTGHYREDPPGTLTTWDINAFPQATAALNGEPLTSEPISVQELFAPGSFAYQCSGNTLKLTPQGQQRSATLVLKRIG